MCHKVQWLQEGDVGSIGSTVLIEDAHFWRVGKLVFSGGYLPWKHASEKHPDEVARLGLQLGNQRVLTAPDGTAIAQLPFDDPTNFAGITRWNGHYLALLQNIQLKAHIVHALGQVKNTSVLTYNERDEVVMKETAWARVAPTGKQFKVFI